MSEISGKNGASIGQTSFDKFCIFGLQALNENIKEAIRERDGK